jgi:hypothetical protein
MKDEERGSMGPHKTCAKSEVEDVPECPDLKHSQERFGRFVLCS